MAGDLAVAAPDADAGIGSAEPAAQWDVLDRLDKGAIGRRGSDGAVSVRRAEPAGCLLYGPYWQLPAGRYRLDFACRAGPPRYAAQPILGVEIIVLNRVQHGWRDFTAGELDAGRGAIVFDVPDEVSREARSDGRFEFRFFHFGMADLAILAARLTRIGPRPALPLPEPAWRLLGRLQKAPRGRRHADGSVSLRRGGAGCLVYGGWPYVRLPRGRYRLRVRGRSRQATGGSPPALAIEIIGHSRWRDGGLWRSLWQAGASRAGDRVRREFAADALDRGEVAVEFAVPSELSLDSGTDAPFEFRLFGLGGAGLTIEAVDLDRQGGDPGPHDGLDFGEPAARLAGPVVHPLRRKNVVLIGNCQSEIVRQGFTRVASLSEQFRATYHFVTLPPNLHEFARRDLAACDILLVQDIRDWENFPLRDCIPPGVETIRFPGVRFASLWPFDAWNGPGDGDAARREGPNLAFPYLDGLLARLRKEIPDGERRFLAYRALDCAGVVNYRRLHEFEARRLLAMDRKFEIEIGAYILEHFRRRRLFHTTVRPTRPVLDMLMRYVLRAIGVRGRHPLPEHLETLLRNPQVPIHPKVARDLGVKWADERTRYLVGGREVTWETYIRRYIDHYG